MFLIGKHYNNALGLKTCLILFIYIWVREYSHNIITLLKDTYRVLPTPNVTAKKKVSNQLAH
jgi:hypothetical protein